MVLCFYVNLSTTKILEMGAILNMKMHKKCHPTPIVIDEVQLKTKLHIMKTMDGVLSQQVCVEVNKSSTPKRLIGVG